MSFYPFVFTGKERDEETGYGYFGARYMDHELMTGWLSVDPMADKYPNITPYNYCMWNPVKLVDPDGEDIWEIDRKGNVMWKEKSDKNILFAIDNRGKRLSQIELKDENILKQLTDTKKCCKKDAVGMKTREGKIEVATSFNKKDIAKLFVFVSQNTDVEWAVYSFRKGKSSKYGIGTFQWDDLSPSEDHFKGLSGWKTFSMIHSHPRPKTQEDEIASLYGDRSVAKKCNYRYYTYMSYSNNLYRLNRDGSYRNRGKQTGYKSLLKYL